MEPAASKGDEIPTPVHWGRGCISSLPMLFVYWNRLLPIMFNLQKRPLVSEPGTFPYPDSCQGVISPMQFPGDWWIFWRGRDILPEPVTSLKPIIQCHSRNCPQDLPGCCPQVFSQVSYSYGQLIRALHSQRPFLWAGMAEPYFPEPPVTSPSIPPSTKWQGSTSCTLLPSLHLLPGWDSASFLSLQPAVWLQALVLSLTNLFSLLPKVSF